MKHIKITCAYVTQATIRVLPCRCGGTPRLYNATCGGKDVPDRVYIECRACGESGPRADAPVQAASGWNEMQSKE